MISVAEADVMSTVPHSRSLTAKAMIYRFVVDRRFVFLYAAIQIRLFPMMLKHSLIILIRPSESFTLR